MSDNDASGWAWLLGGLLLVGGCVSEMTGCNDVSPEDAARYNARWTIQENLKDPSSFDFISEEKTELGWVVKYRATNGFGATVTEEALVTPNGTIIH